MTVIKRFAVLSAVLFSLTACQDQRTESYYFTHPAELQRVLSHCHSSESTSCQVAYHAANRMMKLSQEFVSNQMEFGQRILKAQIHATELSQQLQAAKKNHDADVTSLQKQLNAEQARIHNLLAIVGLFIQM